MAWYTTVLSAQQFWTSDRQPDLPRPCTGWTVDDDRLLRRLARKLNCNWPQIALHFPDKSSSELRLRWSYKLDPDLRKGSWTEAEDTVLETLGRMHGPNWNLLALHLKGRSVPDIRRRWNELAVV